MSTERLKPSNVYIKVSSIKEREREMYDGGQMEWQYHGAVVASSNATNWQKKKFVFVHLVIHPTNI